MIKKIFKLILLLIIIPASMLIYNEVLYFTGWAENPATPDNKATLHFYVINLDRQPERFTAFKTQADKFGINVERVSATDGYKIIFRDRETKDVFTGQGIKDKTKAFIANRQYDVYCSPESYKNNEQAEFIYKAFEEMNRGLTAGEIGCNCSHVKLWKQISKSPDNQLSVIFEDDAVLFDHFDKNFAEFVKSLPDKWDIAYLDADLTFPKRHIPYSIRFLFHFPDLVVNNYFTKIHNEYSTERTHALVINKNSIPTLLAAYNAHNSLVIDNSLGRAIHERAITAYIAKKKIASWNQDIPSELSAMGRNEFGN